MQEHGQAFPPLHQTSTKQTTETVATGDDVNIMFGAEVGTSKIQGTGTYEQEVTFTATTL